MDTAAGRRTPKHQLADALLQMKCGMDLASYVRERRTAGRSWRLIAIDLRNATGGQLDITPESLRAWLAEPADAAVGT